ncbi:hypothetical protein [Streptomyces phaeochromogenes]|uniref:Uncharacterized protein n=1 Tax=Streptomyces phaeochromogenes TaxID=1923 RepID=A0ABZ1H2T3_STRPH|nr:hypothetical protein [Streptomyces phaeochromogenes]WSD11988.1 hypothetical protein OHB35_01490 [Streptomyces phaeochromogenes]WSJ12062.1 hypothetical protein OG437_49885 [Streptomyces phaeochromogenes]
MTDGDSDKLARGSAESAKVRFEILNGPPPMLFTPQRNEEVDDQAGQPTTPATVRRRASIRKHCFQTAL